MSHDPPDNLEARLRAELARTPPASAACPPPGDLAAYVDGRLSADETAGVEDHLAACADCRAAVREEHRACLKLLAGWIWNAPFVCSS